MELDQGVPDKAVIKLNLGILCLTLGQVDEAGVYSGRAHELKRARLTGEERYSCCPVWRNTPTSANASRRLRLSRSKPLQIDGQDKLGEQADDRPRPLKEGTGQGLRVVSAAWTATGSS